MTRPHVVIVEDHALLAETVSLALHAEGLDVTMAGVANRDAILETIAEVTPTLVLLDLDLGDLGDGIQLLPDIVDLGARVLVVTGVHDHVRLASALAAGAIGYVTKDQPFDTLIGTARRACDGEPVIDQNHRHELLATLRRTRADEQRARAPFESLTPRERDVLTAISDGKSVERIAEESFVSTATVRTQVRGILTKLDVGTQLAAVAKARRAGWLSR